jgi:hypothetical protein
MGTVLQADLESAIPAETVRQIFDDDADGTADSAVITHFLETAEAMVLGAVEQLYSDAQIAEMQANPPTLYKLLIVWFAVGLAYDRHPEYVRANGNAWMDRADKLLTQVRKGERGFFRAGLAGPINEQAVSRSGVAASPDPIPRVWDDFGDF